MKSNEYKKSLILWVILVLILLLLSEWAFWRIFSQAKPEKSYQELDERSYHLLLITETRNQDFWDDVYQGVLLSANENDIAVEWRRVDNSNQSVVEAIDSAKTMGLDGILTCVSTEGDINRAINQAVVSGVPVITLMEDVPGSKRHGTVGIDNYSFGISVAGFIEGLSPASRSAIIFTSGTNQDSRLSDKVLLAGLKSERNKNPDTSFELIPIQDDLLQIESVLQGVVLKNRSFDTVICRSTEETYACVNAVIENNLVGKIRILGYGESEELLEYVEKGIVQALITTDGESIGASAMQNYLSFLREGWMNEFSSATIEVVTQENVAYYQIRAKS